MIVGQLCAVLVCSVNLIADLRDAKLALQGKTIDQNGGFLIREKIYGPWSTILIAGLKS